MTVKDQSAQKRSPKIGGPDSLNKLLKKSFKPWKDLNDYGENFCVYIREEGEYLPCYYYYYVTTYYQKRGNKKEFSVLMLVLRDFFCYSVQLCTWE